MGKTFDDEWAKQGKNPECVTIQPLTVAVVENERDVVRAVERANAQGLPICVKSGGHSYTCNSVRDDCFQIDLRAMNDSKLIIEGDKQYLIFGTGALTENLLTAAPESNFTFVHGDCSKIGVGGFYLHGGVNLGYGTTMYGLGGQNVREIEVVLANATVQTISDPVLLGYFTRAGSSFGIVTKIKLEVYKRPSPKVWIIPILSNTWSVEDIEKLYRKIWAANRNRTDNDEGNFQVNLWLQSNSLLAPSLQISYLGNKFDSDSFTKCVIFIEQRMGLKVDMASQAKSKFLASVLFDYGLGYHFFAPPHSLLPHWKAQPYSTSNFIANETQSLDKVRPYLQQAWENKDARCLLLLNIIKPKKNVANSPYRIPDGGLGVDYTCFGKYQHLATEMTELLMQKYPLPGAYWKYYNIPSREENKCRYWPDYSELMNVKKAFDPENRFDIFQGIHKSELSIYNDGDCPI